MRWSTPPRYAGDLNRETRDVLDWSGTVEILSHDRVRHEDNAEALTVSGNAPRAVVQELTRASQELATKNAKNLTAAMQALAAVKSPAEFIELQQRLIKEGVEAAVTDSRHIAQLTTAVFTAAFEPVKKQLEKGAQT